MPTAMQFAFVKSKSVTTKTPLGKLILTTLDNQVQRETKKIRNVALQRASDRIERENRRCVMSSLDFIPSAEKV